MESGEGKVELLTKPSKESCVREILSSVGLSNELKQFDFFAEIRDRGGP